MALNPIPGTQFSGDVDSITRIEIVQDASAAIRVKIHARDGRPQDFEFSSMADAVRFYEAVWSHRSDASGRGVKGSDERPRKTGRAGGK